MRTDVVVRAEYAAISVAAAFFFMHYGFTWYWLLPMFFAYDLGMLGYIVNAKVGAVTYNLTHSLLAPIAMLIAYAVQPHDALLFVALTQLFHIGIDRGLGYGLKYGTNFTHTHLGKIGSKR